MERTKWTDERVDDLVSHVDACFTQVDRRFDEVDRRFDRVEGDIKDLRSLNWWLWATTILTVLGLFVTILLRT
jgi:hypothetical protein